MTPVNPATKILNSAYCRHLIKTANRGAWGASKPPAAPAASAAAAKPLSAKAPQPSIAGAFGGGMLQGAQNIAGGIGNAAIGVKDMAFGAGESLVGPGLRQMGDSIGSWMAGGKSLNALNPRWQTQAAREGEQAGLQMFTAGARDVAGSFGQMFNANEAPQNAAQQYALRQQKYFSHPDPEDQYLGKFNYGVTNAASEAARFLPSAAVAPLAAARLASVPQIARVGQTVNQGIKSIPAVDKTLRGGTVLTGLPLHPEVLTGGNLAGLTGLSQTAQQMVPALAPAVVNLTANAAGMNPADTLQLTQNAATTAQNVQSFLPAVVADEAMRTLHPDAPEIIDAVTMPAAARSTAKTLAFLHAGGPVLQQKIHDNMAPALDSQDNMVPAQIAETLPELEAAYQQDTALHRDLSGQSGTHAVTNAMMQDPAIQNRMTHGRVPLSAAEQIAEEQPLGATPEEQAQNAMAMTQNDPQTQAAVRQDYNNQIQELAANNAAPEEVNKTIDEYLQYASQTSSPEEYEQIQQEVANLRTSLAAIPPEKKEQVVAAAQNPSGAEFQELTAAKEQEIGQQAVTAAQNNPDAPPPTDPQDYGKFINDTWNQAVSTFREMDPMMQLGMSLGLGTGLLGLLGGLGGGGIGTFLLGALGLGAAGFMGAGAGMFGQDAQNFADDMKYNVGSFLGMIPEVNKNELAPLLSANPIAELQKQGPQIDSVAVMREITAMGAEGPARYAKETIAPQIQNAEAQLAKLRTMTQQTPYMISRVTGYPLADAQKMLQNAKAVLADAENPQGQLGSQLARGRAFMANPEAFLQQEAVRQAQEAAQRTSEAVSSGLNYFFKPKQSNNMNIAQHILMEKLITKAARCWAGYEPVPGKKPYSNNSCRPVGGKKKKKKTSAK